MLIYCVITVGRQVEGDIQSTRFEKAFRSKDKADAYANGLNKIWVENVNTPTGPVQFYLERGIHEVELENE